MNFIDKSLEPLALYIEPDYNKFIDLVRSPLSKYNDKVVNFFSCLDNQGLALDDDDSGNGHVYIDQLYILPKASIERIAPEDFAKLEIDNEELNENKFQNIASLIRENPRLILLGDPGIGKSTLVQWLVCSLCHVSENYAKKQIGSLFPLVLTARKLSFNLFGETLSNQDFIDVVITSQGEGLASYILDNEPAKQTLINALKSGQLIFIIDGLDEISSTMKKWLSEQLRLLLIEFPKIHLLLTARVVGFNNIEFWQTDVQNNDIKTDTDSPVMDDNNEDEISKSCNLPTLYFLAPFTSEQRFQFAKNWMKNYLPPNDEQKQQFFEGIIEVSKHSMQLNALSRIPVLLNLICFILWRRGKLPNGRAELYQRIVETYLVTMDKVRLLNLELSDEYDFQDIKNWLAKLALEMQAGELSIFDDDVLSLNDENTLEDLRNKFPDFNDDRLLQISKSQLENFLQLQLTEAVDTSKVRTHSTQLINYISTRTGFLIPRGKIDNEEYYSFSHLSFQEYFSAYALSKLLPKQHTNSSEIEALRATIVKDSWSETWQLVFEELSLNGSSRREVEQYLALLFINPFAFSDTKNDDDSNDVGLKRLPIEGINELVLYAKLITNPAIKISNFQRIKILIKLTFHFTTYDNSEKSITEILLHQIKNNFELYSEAMKNESYITFQGVKVHDWSWMRNLTELKRINLTSTDFSDLEYLQNSSKMLTLYLGHTNVEKLEKITCFPELRRLFLHQTKVIDIEKLQELGSLEELTITGTKVESIEPVEHLKSLVRLDLGNTNVTCIKALSKISTLENLSLYALEIEDFSVISKIKGLRSLNLSNTKIDDLKYIVNLKNLNNLSLGGTKIKDFSQLNKLTTITSLDLAETNFSNLNNLNNLDNLKILDLSGCKIKQPNNLLKIKGLTRLTINGNELKQELIEILRDQSVKVSII